MLAPLETSNYIDEGFALLTEKVPGWIERINWDTLDMANEYNCLLGQLFGDYLAGKLELGIQDEVGFLYGFDAPPHLGCEENYLQLADMWRATVMAHHAA